jgi:FkbM family methyltransferase
MAITSLQARAVTGLYSLTRKSGLLETRFGKNLFTASYFFYKRHLEDPFAALARRRPGMFSGGDILDIGANIGYTAAVFAQASDGDAKVFAFEPEPFNLSLLQSSVRNRGLQSKVFPVHSAVGERGGEIELWINAQHHADHRIATDKLRADKLRADEKYVTVPMTSVDEFLALSDAASPICFIKIDVQGYELAVCRGMTETIAHQPHAVVAIEYMPEAMTNLGHAPQELLNWFSERGFRMFSLGKNGDLTSGLSIELEEKGYVDLIFSRNDLL